MEIDYHHHRRNLAVLSTHARSRTLTHPHMGDPIKLPRPSFNAAQTHNLG